MKRVRWLFALTVLASAAASTHAAPEPNAAAAISADASATNSPAAWMAVIAPGLFVLAGALVGGLCSVLGAYCGAKKAGKETRKAMLKVDETRRAAIHESVGKALLAELRTCFHTAQVLCYHYQGLEQKPFQKALNTQTIATLTTQIWQGVTAQPSQMPPQHLLQLQAAYHAVDLVRGGHQYFSDLARMWKDRLDTNATARNDYSIEWPKPMRENLATTLGLCRALSRWYTETLELRDLLSNALEYFDSPELARRVAEEDAARLRRAQQQSADTPPTPGETT